MYIYTPQLVYYPHRLPSHLDSLPHSSSLQYLHHGYPPSRVSVSVVWVDIQVVSSFMLTGRMNHSLPSLCYIIAARMSDCQLLPWTNERTNGPVIRPLYSKAYDSSFTCRTRARLTDVLWPLYHRLRQLEPLSCSCRAASIVPKSDCRWHTSTVLLGFGSGCESYFQIFTNHATALLPSNPVRGCGRCAMLMYLRRRELIRLHAFISTSAPINCQRAMSRR